MTKRKRNPRTTYTEQEIQLGLTAVAFLNGNTRRAASELKAHGLKVDQKTLWRWSRQDHVDKYEAIRSETTPKAQAWAAEEHRAIAAEQMEVTRDLTKRLKGKAGEIEARDLPGAVRNMSTASAIERDKAQLLAGQPTAIVQRDLTEVLRELKTIGVTVDGTVVAEEDVTDAEALDAGD